MKTYITPAAIQKSSNNGLRLSTLVIEQIALILFKLNILEWVSVDHINNAVFITFQKVICGKFININGVIINYQWFNFIQVEELEDQ